MRRHFRNILHLTLKELRSLFSDKVLVLMIVFVFSVVIYSVSTGVTVDVKNATVAIADHDHSMLSRQIGQAIQPPMFKPPVAIADNEVDTAMDKGHYTFTLDIPPNFEANLLQGRTTKIQLLIDATTMTQAGIGQAYLSQIINKEVGSFLQQPSLGTIVPFEPVLAARFNPNSYSEWYMSVMQVASNVTLLSLILVGAAVIRERERGTIEHLLVMPVSAREIALSKIIANSLVILSAALLSIWLVVHVAIGVPLHGDVWQFALGTAVYLFSATSLGLFLATLAPTMPQFGLLMLPVFVVSLLFSGSVAPRENMPVLAQQLTQYWPMTIYTSYSQDVLFRGAAWSVLWPQLLGMAVMGGLFLTVALTQFKRMLERQG